MGRPKALLPIGPTGETFLDRVTRTLLDAGVDELLVVVGADAEAIRSYARDIPRIQILTNPDYEQGQLTSLVTALRQIDQAAATGAVVTLIDVPLVSADTVQQAHHRPSHSSGIDRSASFERPARTSGDFSQPFVR